MPGAIAQETIKTKPSVRITVRENGRILVPVAVNGKKESRFLFDTGATTTVLSERLAAKAGVMAKSVKRVGTFAGEVALPVGQVDTLRIGNHWVAGIDVLVGDLGRLFNLDAEIEGILGGDFLSLFNYLLDPDRGQLEIEEDGDLSSKLSGTRVACEKRGGKTYVPVAGGDVRLILDSGNPYLVVYEDAASRLQPAAHIKETKVVRSSIGSRAIRLFRIASLQIGDSRLRNVDAYLATRGPGRSEDGFLPLYLFDSIYVNNLENFLIANPQRNLVMVPVAVSLGQVVEERSDARSAEVVQIEPCVPTVAPEVARVALGYFNRGVSRSEKGDHDGAIKDYSSAVSQAGMINNLNDGMAWGLFPLYFAAANLSIERISLLAAAYPAVWGLAQLGTGALSDRTGRKRLIASGMWLQGAAILLIAAGARFELWLGGAIALGLGTAMVYPTLLAAIGDVAHPEWRASAVGVYRLWRDSGYALGALHAGITADLFGLRWAIVIVALLSWPPGSSSRR